MRSAPNDYASYTLTLDVVLMQMESSDYCQIYSKFGANGVWQQLGSYRGREGDRQRYPEVTFNFQNGDPSAQQVYIKLEAAGTSREGRDYCFFDNVYLYGTGRAPATQSNAVAAGKKAFEPMEHGTVDQELDAAQTEFGQYFSLESTASILIWISLLSVWYMVCVMLCWCQRQKSQTDRDVEEEFSGCDNAEDNEHTDMLPDTPPLPEDVKV